MDALHAFTKKLCLVADILARGCFFSVMVLVLANIVMRKVLVRPIMGAYELVGLLTATGIALSLAQCALQDGHIAVTIVTDNLPHAAQRILDVVAHAISLGFWMLMTWSMFVFAGTTFGRGMVSATARLPVYPFIFIIAFGLLCLCLALASALVRVLGPALAAGRARQRGTGRSVLKGAVSDS